MKKNKIKKEKNRSGGKGVNKGIKVPYQKSNMDWSERIPDYPDKINLQRSVGSRLKKLLP